MSFRLNPEMIKEAILDLQEKYGVTEKEVISFMAQAFKEAYKKFKLDEWRRNNRIKKVEDKDKEKFSIEVIVEIDPRTYEMSVYVVKQVVEKVTNPVKEVTVEEARELMGEDDIEAGEEIEVAIPMDEFNRVSINVFKSKLMQLLKNAQKARIFDEYKDMEGMLKTATVFKVSPKLIRVWLEEGKVEAIMLQQDMIRTERLRPRERKKVLIYKVEGNKEKGYLKILVSRTKNEFLKRLFESEIPEVRDGLVEIKKIARKPGIRAKVAVDTSDPKLDPIGACLGVRGEKLRNILNEIGKEEIDVIRYSDDLERFITNALAPVKRIVAISTTREEDEKGEVRIVANVVVPDDQIEKAIGKNGINVELASQLTGCRINVMSESEYREKLNEAISKSF